MVSGKEITLSKEKDKRKVVTEFYMAENNFWHKLVHKRGGTVEENIDNTLKSIYEEAEMIVVNAGKEKAAFFCKYVANSAPLELVGFHVKKEYRNKEFLTEFWSIVRMEFRGAFYTAICSINEAAIEHLKRIGGTIEKDVESNGKQFLIFKL